MSAAVEDSEPFDADRPTVTVAPVPAPAAHNQQSGHPREFHEHHVLIEPEEDRWRWRRKIRQNPAKLAVYRVAVGIAGLFFVCLGFVSGPLPGPGGIPLVLLGLAIWSSEFEWAQRLMLFFKAQLRRFRGWSRAKQTLAWVIFFACCGAFGYTYLLVIGVPGWLPDPLVRLIEHLPGV